MDELGAGDKKVPQINLLPSYRLKLRRQVMIQDEFSTCMKSLFWKWIPSQMFISLKEKTTWFQAYNQ
jgi:hypothetical protein